MRTRVAPRMLRLRNALGAAGAVLAALVSVAAVARRVWLDGRDSLDDWLVALGVLACAGLAAQPLGARRSSRWVWAGPIVGGLLALPTLLTHDATLFAVPLAVVLATLAAQALRGARRLARARVVLGSATLLLGVSVARGVASGIAHSTNCDASWFRPDFVSWDIAQAQLLRAWGAGSAAIAVGALAWVEKTDAGPSTRSPALAYRLAAAALAFVALDAAAGLFVADEVFESEVPQLFAAPLRLDAAAFERIAVAVDAFDSAAGLGLGVALAFVLLGSIGPRGRSMRSALASLAPCAVLAAWLVGAPNGARHVFAWVHWVTPVWERAGVRPPVLAEGERTVLVPALDRATTWVVDARGQVVALYEPLEDADRSELEIVADEAVDLRTLVRMASSQPRVRLVVVVGRTRRAASFDAAPEARARFASVEALARGVAVHRFWLASEDELLRAEQARQGSRPPWGSAWGDCVRGAPWLDQRASEPGCRRIVREVPAELGVEGLDGGHDTEDVLVLRSDDPIMPTLPPPRAVPAPVIPASRWLLGPALLLGCALAAVAMWLAALVRWPRRRVVGPPASSGAITPAWVPARACDASVEVPDPTYRTPVTARARTARSFVRASALAAWDACVEARAWLPMVLGVAWSLAWALGAR